MKSAAAIHKLSKLQKYILLQALKGAERIQEERNKLAMENPERALATGPPAIEPDNVLHRGVLYLGLPKTPSPHTTRDAILDFYYWLPRHDGKWGFKFDTRDPRYASANACLYRALKSLEKRGLIQRGDGEVGNMVPGIWRNDKPTGALSRQIYTRALTVLWLPLIRQYRPNTIYLSGSWARKLGKAWCRDLPDCKIKNVCHPCSWNPPWNGPDGPSLLKDC